MRQVVKSIATTMGLMGWGVIVLAVGLPSEGMLARAMLGVGLIWMGMAGLAYIALLLSKP